jgi:hypothetical protein
MGQLHIKFSLLIYSGYTPVGNATLVVANVLTCNKYSQKKYQRTGMPLIRICLPSVHPVTHSRN